MKRLLAPVLASAFATALAAAPVRAEGPGVKFHLSLGYGGRLLVRVLDVSIEEAASDSGFGSNARVKSSGVLALFKKVDVRASAQGHIAKGEAEPGSFVWQNFDGKSNRKVDVTWTGADVTTAAQPGYGGKLGDPPASRAQRLEATDPLAGLMRITLGDNQGQFCRGVWKFFDGKQRYDLEFLNRGVSTPTSREKRLGLVNPVRCTVRFREIAGFKKKAANKQNQGLNKPILLGFAEVGQGGPWVISFLDADTPLGHAVIELERVHVTGVAP